MTFSSQSPSFISCPPVKDGLISTLNKMGYMMAKPDAFNQAFIDFSACCDRPVLDLGCAYGVSTVPALMCGATVIANDLEARHLEILKSNVALKDRGRLSLRSGPLEDLDLESSSLGAVLASRVLNFVPPDRLPQTFCSIYRWLDTGGKFFFLGGSPYSGTYASFLPHYHRNKQEGMMWPGYITDMRRYTESSRVDNLPNFVTLLDRDEVQTLMAQAGFQIETLCYVAVDPDNPETMKKDGREYVGAIGVKS